MLHESLLEIQRLDLHAGVIPWCLYHLSTFLIQVSSTCFHTTLGKPPFLISLKPSTSYMLPKRGVCYLLLANDSWPTGKCVSEQLRLGPYGEVENFIRCQTIPYAKCFVSILQQAHTQSPRNTRREKIQQ